MGGELLSLFRTSTAGSHFVSVVGRLLVPV
jgi:hypothetical protein